MKTNAFTIIELMTVIAIILIIIGIGFPAYNSQRNRATIAKARATIAMIELALERYRTDNGVYPPSEELNNSGQLRTYLEDYMDFNEDDMSGAVLLDPWGNNYSVYADHDGDTTTHGAGFDHNWSTCYIYSEGPTESGDDDIDNYGPM